MWTFRKHRAFISHAPASIVVASDVRGARLTLEARLCQKWHSKRRRFRQHASHLFFSADTAQHWHRSSLSLSESSREERSLDLLKQFPRSEAEPEGTAKLLDHSIRSGHDFTQGMGMAPLREIC